MANEQRGRPRACGPRGAPARPRPRARWAGNRSRSATSATSASGTSKKRGGPRVMARGAATGIRRGPPGAPRRPRGCGAGSVEGTGSAAGWLPPSPWVRLCPCLFLVPLCSFWICLSTDRARSPGRRPGRPGVPLRWWLPRSRALVSLRGLPPWHDQSRSICQIDATSNCRQVALQKQADASANHRSRAGKERSGRPGRNCGASQTAARDDEQRVMS